MRYHIQILSTPKNDCSSSILFHFDSQRYLINCGEGTQRFCNEKRVRLLSKLKNIFVSRMSWDAVGGIPGMLLTLSDAGCKDVNIYGPENLTHFMTSMRHFIYRQELSVDIHEFRLNAPETSYYKDENITMTPIIINPTEQDTTDETNSNNKRRLSSSSSSSPSGDSQNRAMKRHILSKMFSGTSKQDSAASNILSSATPTPTTTPPPKEQQEEEQPESNIHLDLKPDPTTDAQQSLPFKEIGRFGLTRLPSAHRHDVSICYVVQGPEVPGKFNPKAAKELGLPPGPLYGKLQKGESVESPVDGKIIHPSQVVGPSRPGSIWMILDLPTNKHVTALLASESKFTSYSDVRCIIHNLGKDVTITPEYRAFSNKFGAKTQHIVLSPNYNRHDITFCSHAFVQHKLGKIDNQVFPMPWSANKPMNALSENFPKNAVAAEPLLKFIVEPTCTIETDDVTPPITFSSATPKGGPKSDAHFFNSLRQEIKQQGERASLSSKQQQANDDLNSSILELLDESTDATSDTPASTENFDDLTVIPLGTGSAVPAKYRNVSSTLVQTPNNDFNILLDAGEGTFGQMIRALGPEECIKNISNIKCLFISHLHADHHLGTVKILKEWSTYHRDSPDATIYLIGPYRLWTFLHEYSECEEIGLDRVVFINAQDICDGNTNTSETTPLENVSKIMSALSLTQLQTVRVDHCPWAYAFVITHQSGWKVVYSGDCRPSTKLAELGKNATILIHEATFNDDMTHEAIDKKHSTTGEAVSVANSMGARHLMLTHFSQRYPKIPDLRGFGGNGRNELTISVAFDMMRYRVGDAWKWPFILKGLAHLFRDEHVDLDDNGQAVKEI